MGCYGQIDRYGRTGQEQGKIDKAGQERTGQGRAEQGRAGQGRQNIIGREAIIDHQALA